MLLLYSLETTTDRFNGPKLRLLKKLVMQAKVYTTYKVNDRDALMSISGFN